MIKLSDHPAIKSVHFQKVKSVWQKKKITILLGISLILISATGAFAFYFYHQSSTTQLQFLTRQKDWSSEAAALQQQLDQTTTQLTALQAEDQRVKNVALEKELKDLQTTFKDSLAVYEDILKLKQDNALKLPNLDKNFALTLKLLSEQNYASASSKLAELRRDIQKEQSALATASAGISTANLQKINTAPDSGYRRQVVTADVGEFVVDIVTGDLNSTRVVVETASSGDCKDNCPVSSLGDFVARAGGYAGVNGPYFCPAAYPSCVGKANSFDTLLMNRQKFFFNVENNVYSLVPAVVFSGGSANFYGRSMDVPRDGGADAVIAAQPRLVSNGEVAFGGDGDPKKGSRGARSFIGATGSKVYIGVVRGATVAEVGHVLKTMGVQNALNLDSGGSTALMFNGKYLAGPGRATPFGIVLVRK